MRIIREPLLQFLLIGGGLFAVYTLTVPEGAPPPERIVVDAPVIESLEQQYAAVWQHPPAAAELEGLIDDYVAEEVLYREAQKLGLDQDDVVIRRRLRQKMEFLLQDSLAADAPDEAALEAFFEAHRERYRAPDRVSFRQIYLGDQRTESAASQWLALIGELNSQGAPDPVDLEKRSLLPATMNSAPLPDVDRTFGDGFGELVAGMPAGQWAGPIESAYGWHVVLLGAVERAAEPEFSKVRKDVERDLVYQREREGTNALLERMKQNYDIVIDRTAE